MLLPKLIEDKIRGYLHPPCVYIFKGSSYYTNYSDDIKIYDEANWKTGVKNFLSQVIKNQIFANKIQVNFEELEKIEDFPYELLTTKKKLRIDIKYQTLHNNYDEIEYFWLYMMIEKKIINEKWQIDQTFFDINKDKSLLISIFLIQNHIMNLINIPILDPHKYSY